MVKPYPSNELRIIYIRLKRMLKSFYQPTTMRTEENVRPQLRMRAQTRQMVVLNQIDLPEGYHRVHYQPAVNSAWRKLINESEEFGQLSEDAFYLALLDNLVPDGVGLIRFQNELAACASINYQGAIQHTATINYVLTKSAHRGNGLGGLAVAIVLNSARKVGVETVQLFTDDARLAAIKLYLKLGFKPDYAPHDQKMAERWDKVLTLLKK